MLPYVIEGFFRIHLSSSEKGAAVMTSVFYGDIRLGRFYGVLVKF